MKPLIAGIGELLWDILPGGKETGGAPANFAYHVQSLGGDGITISSIGDDEPGNEIFNRFNTLSLKTDYLTRDRIHPTGTVTIKVDTAGKPTYDIHENVAWDFIPRTPQLEKLAGKIDAVFFGCLGQRSEVSRKTIEWFVKKAYPRAICIFDATLRQSYYTREIIDSSLHLAHILKLSDDELRELAGLFSLDGDEIAQIRYLAEKYHLKLVAFTRGSKGSILYSSGKMVEHPGYKTRVVDTVGAGDSFAAALVIGLLKGFPLEFINDAANRIASFVCSRRGATPELPEELREIYRNGGK